MYCVGNSVRCVPFLREPDAPLRPGGPDMTRVQRQCVRPVADFVAGVLGGMFCGATSGHAVALRGGWSSFGVWSPVAVRPCAVRWAGWAGLCAMVGGMLQGQQNRDRHHRT